MSITTVMAYHFISTGMAIIKETNSCDKDLDKLTYSYNASGNENY